MKLHSSKPLVRLPARTDLTLYVLQEDLKARALVLSMEKVGGLHPRWQVDLYPLFKALSGMDVSAETYDQAADYWTHKWMSKPQKSRGHFALKWFLEMGENPSA
jgi:hypothetical protein